MKKILFILSVCFFVSCSRDNSITRNSSNANIEIAFDLDGQHYSFAGEPTGVWVGGFIRVGVYGFRSLTQVHYIYGFTGATDGSNNINLDIQADSLKTITYHEVGNNYPFSVLVASNYNYYCGNGDYLDITISDYKNGMVNGAFSGRVTRTISVTPLVVQHATITSGLIKNVKLVYN